MHQPTPRPSWPTPQPDPETAAALAAYEALSPAERQRVARLVSVAGCTLAQAIAAVVALRPVA